MLFKEQIGTMYQWMHEGWYRIVDNTYMYELTDAAPPKARESYAKYKAAIDHELESIGKTPYEGVIINL